MEVNQNLPCHFFTGLCRNVGIETLPILCKQDMSSIEANLL